MKAIKKFGAVFVALAMCFSLACVAFAANDAYDITISNPIGGTTYSAYKVFDATYNEDTDAVIYTITESDDWYDLVKNDSESPFILTASADGTYYIVTTESTGSEIAAWFNGLDSYPGSAAASGQTENGEEVVLNVSSSGAGYYVISGGYTTEGATVSLTTAAPDATVIDKNQTPGGPGGPGTPDDPDYDGKLAKDDDESGSVSIGDEVTYTIRSYVPTYSGENEIGTYVITDVMEKGLTYDEDAVILINGTGIDEYEDITDFCTIETSTDADGNTVLTVTWNPAEIEAETDYIYPADAVVTITYTDTVNEYADELDLHNSVSLAWYYVDSDPDDPSTPPDGSTDTGDDVYTYGFILSKVDGSDNTALTGATFTLEDEAGNTITFDEKDGGYEVSSNTTDDEIEAGSVYIWGLGEGTYTLTEITAPEGYNLLSQPVSISITAITSTSADGDTVTTGWTVSVDNTVVGTAVFDENGEHGLTSAGIPTVTIENNAGSELPGTGGMGTTIFYIIGGVLVAGAAVVLITRRRMSSES